MNKFPYTMQKNNDEEKDKMARGERNSDTPEKASHEGETKGMDDSDTDMNLTDESNEGV